MKRTNGFTLIELMITVAVMGILASIAFPNFIELIRDQQTTSQANILLGSIQTARSEAVKRAANVTMAPASGTNWSTGWCIYTGADCKDANILRQHEASASIVSGPGAAIVFNSLGQAGGTQTFVLRPSSCAAGAHRQRTLVITPTGRSNITPTTCP